MLNRRSFLGSAIVLSTPIVAQAQEYPDSPINIVTPLAPGDAADSAARLMGKELNRLLGVPVTVSNHPGAGGSIGTELVIRAPKDGYTILYAQNSPLTIRRVLDPATAAYDPVRDLTPLALTTRTPSILVARSDAKFKNFKEMVDQARSAPGTINIGNAGPGSAGDISVQLMSSMTETDIKSINYKGAAPGISDLLGGHIDGVVLALGALSAHIKSGKLRGIAISSPFPEFPDIPTLGQLGYKQELQGVWFAFFMPAGVPKIAVDKMTATLEAVVNNKDLANQLKPMGIVQEWNPAPALIEEMDREFKTVQSLFKKNGIHKK